MSREIYLVNGYDSVTTLHSKAKSSVFPSAQKLSRLFEAVAIFCPILTYYADTARHDG